MLRSLRRWVTGSAAPAPQPVPSRPPASLPAPLDVTDADFAPQVLEARGLVVVDFWAEWCAPCTIMSAHVMLLAQEFGPGLTLAALDVDENSETPAHYQVMGLPTLIFFHQGVEIDRQVGIAAYEDLRRRVEGLLAAVDSPTA